MRRINLLLLLVIAITSASFALVPARKCPATMPESDQTCPVDDDKCTSNPGVTNITCSTKDDGECDPGTFPCRWSCTVTITGQGGSGYCISGASAAQADCKNGTFGTFPGSGLQTLQIAVSDELACASDFKTWQISFYTLNGTEWEFQCCEAIKYKCGPCALPPPG